MSSRLLYVEHHSSHHQSHSGYLRVTGHLPCEVIPEVELRFPPWRLQRLLARRCRSVYSTTSFSKELMVFRKMLSGRDGVVHFLSGEHDFHYLAHARHLNGWRSVATFHKPPSILAELFRDSSVLRALDGAVCVGTNQLELLQRWIAPERVWFVPHGADTDFFAPDDAPDCYDDSLCLFVGQHLRDFEMLGRAVTALASRARSLKVLAIVRDDCRALVPAHRSIEVRSGMSELELREHYRRAALLLLPLTDCTANNTVLEALACGLPVVTTDVGAIRDYIDDSCAVAAPPGSVEGIVEAASALLDDRGRNLAMRAAARERALRFSWPDVARALAELYRREFSLDLAA